MTTTPIDDSQRVVPGDLLPCPFCDGEPNLQNHPAHGFRAFCDYGADHAVFIGGEDGTEVAAIAAWNRRAPTASPPVAPEDRRDGERSVLYYECHITIEPVLEDDRRAILEATIKPYGFRLAELLFQRHRADTPERSAKDSFTTARGDNFDELANRMHLCRHALMAAGFEVWRYKIEAALVDCRRAAIDAARDDHEGV